MEWYQDLLLNILNILSAGVEGGALDDLTKTPEQYAPELFTAMVTVHDVAVKPVTSVVLSIMFVLMLAQNSTRTDGDKELGVRIVAATMFKIVMVFTAAQSSMLILRGIAEAASFIAREANKVDVRTGGSFKPLGDRMKDQISGMDMMSCLMGVTLTLLPFIIASVATVIVLVLLLLRILQMDLLIAFSSLPIAFLGHEDTKQFGVGYLRAFAVTAISGAVLVISVKLSQAITPQLNKFSKVLPKESGDVVTWLAMNYGPLLAPPVVLLLLFFTANGLAKKVFGEG